MALDPAIVVDGAVRVAGRAVVDEGGSELVGTIPNSNLVSARMIPRERA